MHENLSHQAGQERRALNPGLPSALRNGSADPGLPALDVALTSYAFERGKLRGAIHTNLMALSQVDQEIQPVLDRLGVSAKTDTNLISSAREAYENGRLAALHDVVSGFGLVSGLTQGRKFDPVAYRNAEVNFNRYVEHQRDLFERHADLAKNSQCIFEAAECRGTDMRLAADQAAVQLYRAMGLTRHLSSAEKVYKTLHGRSAQELALLKEAVEQRYGRSAEDLIMSGLSGVKRIRAINLLSGNKIAALSDAIYLGAHHRNWHGAHRPVFGPRELTELRGLTSPERRALAADYNERYAAPGRSTEFAHLIRDFPVVHALMQGRHAYADAAQVSEVLSGPEKKRVYIYKFLERLKPEEIPLLAAAYAATYQENLRGALKYSIPAGAGSDRALAILDGDPEALSATKIRCCIERLKGETIAKLFYLKSDKERGELILAYEKYYGRESFWPDLRGAFKGRDYEILESLIRTGNPSKAELLYHFTVGLGTDEAGIRIILRDISAEELQKAVSEFHNLWLKRCTGYERFLAPLLADLHTRLWLETGGESWFDIEEALKGPPQTNDAKLARVTERHRHERSGSLIRRVDLITREGPIMDRDVQAVEQFYREQIEPMRSEELGVVKQRRFDALLRYAQQDFEAFRSAKNSVTGLLSNVAAAVTAGATGWAVFAGGAHVYQVMLAVAGASLATRLVSKALLKGHGYGREEVARDFGFAVVDGATLFMNKLVTGVAIQKGLNLAARLGLKSVIGMTRALDQHRTSEHVLCTGDLQPIATASDAPAALSAKGRAPTINVAPLDFEFERNLARLN